MTKPTFDLPPDELRRLGELTADAVASHRADLFDRPVFGKLGSRAALFEEKLPEEGRPFEEVLAFAREHILPYAIGNSHPRFFGFIQSSADPVGTMADFLAAGMNNNCWGGDQAAVHVEQLALRWLAEMLGFPVAPREFSSRAARWRTSPRSRPRGRAMTPGRPRGRVRRADAPPLMVYASDQVHACVDKAVDLLGIGTKQLRKIATDERFRIRMPARGGRRRRPARGLDPRDRRGQRGYGQHGRVDPLDELADFCAGRRSGSRRRRVRCARLDLPALSAALRRHRARRLDRGRSAQVALRALRGRRHARARAGPARRRLPQVPAPYLVSDPDSPFPGPVSFDERGVELSRGFKALKVWMGLKRHGRRGTRRSRERLAMARFLADEVDRRPRLRAPRRARRSRSRLPLPPGRPPALRRRARAHQPPIVNRLVGSGVFFLAPTLLKGRTAMRVAIINFRTTEEDLRRCSTRRSGSGARSSRPSILRRHSSGRARQREPPLPPNEPHAPVFRAPSHRE